MLDPWRERVASVGRRVEMKLSSNLTYMLGLGFQRNHPIGTIPNSLLYHIHRNNASTSALRNSPFPLMLVVLSHLTSAPRTYKCILVQISH